MKSINLKWCWFAILIVPALFLRLEAQMHIEGNFHVADLGVAYLDSGNLSFGTVGNSSTSRSVTNFGKLAVGATVTTSSASSSNYVDGYVRIARTTGFVLPIGQDGVYAPIKLEPSVSTAVDCAYWRANPAGVGSILDGSINAVSSLEYWELNTASNSALVSLSWRNFSNLTALTGADLTKLVIAAWDGTKWVQLPSSVEVTSFLGSTSTLTEGSIRTDVSVDLATYRYFTLATKGDCAPLVASSGIVKTWDGSTWSPSAPSIYDPVVINAPYIGDLSCNALTLNADVTLNNGNFLELVNGATGSGKLIMASQASFVQRNSSASAPAIELTKRTRNLRRFDYVYWGTPIAGNFFNQLNGAKALSVNTTGAFDLKYRYVSGPGGGWQNLTSITTGSGYIMRVRPVAPFTTTTATDQIDLKFTGTSNNGDITVPIAFNSAAPNGATSHNLLANPYPSAIDGDMFLRLNTNIDGVIYVWQQSTPPGNSLQTSYTQADYLAYTRAGFVAPNGTGAFDGKIASGQGFQVKALSNGAVTFTNCMRLTGSNTSFYRESPYVVNSEQPIDRYKLTMTNGDGSVFSQILVAYLQEGTYDYDRMFDAGRNSVSTAQLYSILPSNNRRLAINARPPFDINDAVPVGFSKSTTSSEQFTLSLSSKEGLFADNSIWIFLHDKQTGLLHDLATPFELTLNSTVLNDRYELVYQDTALNTPDFNGVVTAAYVKNQTLYVATTEPMQHVQVYDLTGKLIQEFKIPQENSVNGVFPFAQGVYVLKVQLTNNQWYTHKLITSR
ncbi:T9SS type A sorting domain-containing protein [Flavobacterium sp.]|jgi:hypothetical protein|uniref:T9SS type A sorting domain-containing protein n=1 Tax=Flavobacterium sp. TaxID=239 RepID=UPI00391DC92C